MFTAIAKFLIARNPAMTMAHALRLAKVGLGAALLLALLGLFLWWNAAENADDKANQKIGAAIEREGALTRTLERTEQGNEARDTITRDLETNDGRSCAVYNQCLRTARTPANCERFLPERQADQCGATSGPSKPGRP